MSGEQAPKVSEAVAERLATEWGVWLATRRRSGAPHVTPVWFVFDPSPATWWVSTGADSVKVRNILHRPEVSLALEDGRRPVVAEGTARVHRDGFPPRVVGAFADKYEGWDINVPYSPGDVRVLVEVTTVRWLLQEP